MKISLHHADLLLHSKSIPDTWCVCHQYYYIKLSPPKSLEFWSIEQAEKLYVTRHKLTLCALIFWRAFLAASISHVSSHSSELEEATQAGALESLSLV